MSKIALIILDLQTCFINDKTKNLPRKIAEHISKNHYDFLIFTKFVNLENSNFIKRLNYRKCMKPPETNIVPELTEIAKKNCIFEKNTYSVFKSKEFVDFLRDHEISKLYFCGLDCDACLLASAFEAFDLNLDFKILSDLIDSSSSKDICDSTKQIIKRNLQIF